MSGVSVTDGGSNIDLDALVAGGDTFIARVKELQDAKAKADASYAALNIGKDAQAALAEAQAREATALKLIADAKEEAASTVAIAKQQAADITTSAQDEADAILKASQDQADGLDAQVGDAKQVLADWSAKTTADANAIMASAVATKALADKQLADNQAAAKQISQTQSDLEVALAKAAATQLALNAKLEAIKAAAS